MAQRKKLTKNQIEFKKQQDRIKRFIKRAEKRGYEFDKNVIPQMPKRVTQKALKTITNLKPQQLYKQAEYVDRQTGEYLSGVEGRKIERAIATQKAKETRRRKNNRSYYSDEDSYYDTEYSSSAKVIINNIYEELKSFPTRLTAPLIQLIKTLVKENGEEDVARMWQDMDEKFNECLSRVMYDSNSAVAEYSAKILEFMPNVSEQHKKDLMEKFEYHELGFEIEYED